MKCAKCGYSPPRGRPKKIDSKELTSLVKQKQSLREIAKKLGVTHGAIAHALKRASKLNSRD